MTKKYSRMISSPPGKDGKEGTFLFLADVLCIAKAGLCLICISKNIIWANVQFIMCKLCVASKCNTCLPRELHCTDVYLNYLRISIIYTQAGPLTTTEVGNGRFTCNLLPAQTSCWIFLLMFTKNACTVLFPLQSTVPTAIIRNTQPIFHCF